MTRVNGLGLVPEPRTSEPSTTPDAALPDVSLVAELGQAGVLLAHSPDVLCVYSLAAGRTVWTSQPADVRLGHPLSPDHLDNGDLRCHIHERDLQAYDDVHRRAAGEPDGRVTHADIRARHADGSWRVLSHYVVPYRRAADGTVTHLLSTVRDVTAQRRITHDLYDAKVFQASLLQATPDLMTLVDTGTGAAVWSSRPQERPLGWPAEDAVMADAAIDELVHPEDRSARRELVVEAGRACGDVVQGTFRMRHAEGGWRWVSVRAVSLRGADDAGQRVLLATRDVTTLVEAQQALEHASLHDPLTDLPNRMLVLDRLTTAVSGVTRGGSVGVLFVDLDGFKRINDAFGHAAGDAVLGEVARRLRFALRPGDTVGRMGGDEFVVILSGRGEVGADASSFATVVAERLRQSVNAPIEHEGQLHLVSASIGIALARAGDDPASVLRDADGAMYVAKARGKNRWASVDPAQLDASQRDAHVEAALRSALDDGGLEVWYQPVLRVDTGAVEHREALVRVRDDEGVLLDTARVIGVAEQTGLILELGRRVLAQACASARSWQDSTCVAVNMSAREVAQPDLHRRVLATLDAIGLDPKRLVLELTESVALEAAESTLKDLRRLRDDGVGIALDDFGTGYASLHYLLQLPVSCVKVDRSFTAGLGSDPVATTLVRTTIGLADELGISCVVEGVERDSQLAELRSWPRVHAQGYLLGRPEPEARVA